jgi:hypothetical protein
MPHSPRYARWNAALAEHFFRPREAGDPAYLAVDDEELAEIAASWQSPPEDPASDLARGVRATLAATTGLAAWVHAVPEWRLTHDVPPYIAVLGLCVLAASRMATDPDAGIYSNDYYKRLNPLLGRSADAGMPGGFEALDCAWRDLAQWLDEDEDGRRGWSTIRTHPHFTHIGYPMSQCILRAVDRARLPDFFRFAGFEPREDVAGGRLLTLFRAWARPGCGLSHTGLRAARATNETLQHELGEVLTTELRSWDGELRDRRGRRRGDISVLVERFAGGRRVELSLHARRPEGFPDGSFRTESGATLELVSSAEGWYAPLAIPVTAKRLATPFTLTRDAFSLSFSADRVVPLREAFQPSGWLEVGQIVPFEPHMVLLHASLRSEAQRYAAQFGDEGWELRTPRGLPDGWLLLDGLRLRKIPDHAPPELLRLAPRLVASLSLSGGLPLGPRTYLSGGEPDLQVTFSESDEALVELDGVEQRFNTPVVELALSQQRLAPGEHEVRAGGQRRTFRSENGFGDEQPQHAGSMAIVLEKHASYVPAGSETEPVDDESPKRGSVHISGAHVEADPEDLPLVPAKPIVLRRMHHRWQLLGPRAGDYDEGRVPGRPQWFATLPHSPTCPFFEVHPRFAPELAIYLRLDGSAIVRPILDDLAMPTWSDDSPRDQVVPWAEAVRNAQRRTPEIPAAVSPIWDAYVNVAESILS